ncbi:MAG: S1 family peptidase, partial [Myxococcales bacterium]
MTLVRRTGISVATCRPALLTPLLLLLSCAPGPDALHPPQVGRANASIRNGVIDTGHPAVVYLVGSGTCTGTLVAPTKVLTAAHCVERVGLGSVTFGPDTLGPSVLFHRAAIPPSWPADLGADIAVVTLDNPVLAVEPTRLQLAPLASSLVGRTVTLVGYGQTGPDGEGTGVKRKVDVTLGGMGPKTLSYSASANGGKSSDKGDSGGPALLDVDGEEVVVGVCSRGAFLNPDVGIYVRVDAWADWLRSQGVPVQSCADASGCPAPQKCLHGSCADPDVAPCNPDTFHAHDGCPSGQACTLEPGASGYERTCVAAGLLTEGVGAPCGPTARCQRGAVCRPGPSGSVCVPLCNRNLPNS